MPKGIAFASKIDVASIADIYTFSSLCHDSTNMFGKKKQRVYLDWAAATPLLEESFNVMKPFLSVNYANPSAIHKEGLIANKAMETARQQVSSAIQVQPENVIFTSGGTESNNLAIWGIVEGIRKKGRRYEDMEVITTGIEHPSVSKVFDYLTELGVSVKKVAVDEVGKVVLSDLKDLLSEKTVLFSVAYANSEIGTVQSTRSIKKILKKVEDKFQSQIYFHVDAAQTPLWLNCQFSSVGADLLTFDSLKCCGPKGVGMLIKDRRVKLVPVVKGGGQEQNLRSGTENVAGIVGAGVAFSLAQKDYVARAEKTRKVRDKGIEILLKNINGSVLNGPTGEARLANNINISIPGFDTEYAAVFLDSRGFAVSTKSACAGAGGGESSVVMETSSDPARALATLRFTLGPDTTVENLQSLTETLVGYCKLMEEHTLINKKQ